MSCEARPSTLILCMNLCTLNIELGKLSGVAAILRFPVPDVESSSDEDDDNKDLMSYT